MSLNEFDDILEVGTPSAAPLWLSDEHEQLFEQWKRDLRYILPMYTASFTAIHLLSAATCGHMDTCSMPKKDKSQWHNKVVSAVHAAGAFGLGLYWILGSGEWPMIGSKTFVFFPQNAHIAAFGMGYFIYDFFAMLWLRPFMKPALFLGIMVHHIIFIAAYISTLVIPCALSVTAYHLFQLTELSTIFLHLSWMASKAQVQYYRFFMVSIVLLITFGIRVITNGYVVLHVVTRLLDLKLWMGSPVLSKQAGIAYSIFFATGTIGMMYMNFTWFNMLIAKAKDMVKRVQNGKSPNPDYDRPIKVD